MGRKARTIAVDFDGVIASWSGWKGAAKIDPPIEGAREFLLKIKALGHKIMIFSARADEQAGRSGIIAYMQKHDLAYDSMWCGKGKPDAAVFIDDRAITCRPQFNDFAYERALEGIDHIVENGTKVKK